MSSSSAPPRGSILLVEDSLDQAHLMIFLLEQAGFKVTLAQDGIRGCQLAEDGEWVLVVTDLNLPGRDGMDVIHAAKEHSPNVPVLAVTGFVREAFIDQAMRAGADDIMEKPVEKDELLNKVDVMVRQAEEARKRNRKRVLAVGAYPGAVEFGVGGTLLKHIAGGDQVVICPLTDGGFLQASASLRTRAEDAASAMEAQLLPPAFMLDVMNEARATDLVLSIVRELDPTVVYAHSAHEGDPVVDSANRAAVSGSGGVESLLCFESPATESAFRPEHFEELDSLDAKLKIIDAYRGLGDTIKFADPALVEAVARERGRQAGMTFAEALEVTWSN